jgi:hypothetical protein
MLDALGEHAVADSLSHSRYSKIRDAEIRTVIKWGLNTNKPESETRFPLSLSAQQAPEVIGTAVFYHYINRMVTILLSETPLPSNKTWLKSSLRRIAGKMFAKAVDRPKIPGESLRFLPAAEMPEDLRWAEANPVIAEAFARFSSVICEVGEQALSPKARGCVEAFLGKWRGDSLPPNTRWVDDETDGFEEPVKSVVQLALLTAVAPWQVDERRIFRFREFFSDEYLLLGTLAWGSFTAARRIGLWIAP